MTLLAQNRVWRVNVQRVPGLSSPLRYRPATQHQLFRGAHLVQS